jgi:ribonuclease HII
MKNEGIIIIDGRDNYIFSDFPEVNFLIRGDDIVRQIMAASIVAKVTRDRMMIEYAQQFP